MEAEPIDIPAKGGMISLTSTPDKCPVCNAGIRSIHLSAYEVSKDMYVVFRCPINVCSALFFGVYSLSRSPVRSTNFRGFDLQTTKHVFYVKEESFSNPIKDLSPDFVEIYRQAHIADKNALTQIAGPGYRKALEFLVKDYLIKFKYKDDPINIEKVKKAFLGNCIKEHIEDQRIKEITERAVWLGNDETHYERKWEGKDLVDFVNLIKIVSDLVVLDLDCDSVMKEMESKK